MERRKVFLHNNGLNSFNVGFSFMKPLNNTSYKYLRNYLTLKQRLWNILQQFSEQKLLNKGICMSRIKIRLISYIGGALKEVCVMSV